MYFPRNWESGTALSKLRTLGGVVFKGGFEPPTLGTPLLTNKHFEPSQSDAVKKKVSNCILCLLNAGEGT
jgi:hypothetical protein